MGGALKMHTTKAFVAQARAQNAINPDGVSTDGFVFEGDTHALDAMLQLPEVALLAGAVARARRPRHHRRAVPGVAGSAQDGEAGAQALGITVEKLDTALSQSTLLHGLPELGQRLLRHVRLRLQLLELGVRRLLLPWRLCAARHVVPPGQVVLLLQHHGRHRAVWLLARASVAGRPRSSRRPPSPRALRRRRSTPRRRHHRRQRRQRRPGRGRAPAGLDPPVHGDADRAARAPLRRPLLLRRRRAAGGALRRGARRRRRDGGAAAGAASSRVRRDHARHTTSPSRSSPRTRPRAHRRRRCRPCRSTPATSAPRCASSASGAPRPTTCRRRASAPARRCVSTLTATRSPSRRRRRRRARATRAGRPSPPSAPPARSSA